MERRRCMFVMHYCMTRWRGFYGFFGECFSNTICLIVNYWKCHNFREQFNRLRASINSPPRCRHSTAMTWKINLIKLYSTCAEKKWLRCAIKIKSGRCGVTSVFKFIENIMNSDFFLRLSVETWPLPSSLTLLLTSLVATLHIHGCSVGGIRSSVWLSWWQLEINEPKISIFKPKLPSLT